MEYKENGVKFNRIDADLSDVLKDKNENKDSEENKEEIAKIEGLFKEAVGERVKNYSVEGLRNEDTPAMVLVSEQSIRMAEMQSRFAGMDLGMNFEEEKTLVINENSPIIKNWFLLKMMRKRKIRLRLFVTR